MSRISRVLDCVDAGVVMSQAIAASIRESAAQHRREVAERAKGFIRGHSAPYMPAGYIDDVVLPDSEDTSDIPPTS